MRATVRAGVRVAPAALSLGIALALGATLAQAQSAPAVARWVPPAPDPRHVFVLDSAHLLSDAEVRALQDSSRALQAETHADVVWVTLPSLGGRPVEEAALYVGRQWKAGDAGAPGAGPHDRGLVVLYVPDRTSVAGPNFRAEVGRGLEGSITDSRSRRISAAMRADLKAKRYDDAYAKGWTAAALLVREAAADDARHATMAAASPAVSAVAASAPREHTTPPLVVVAVALLAAALLGLVVWLITRALSRRLRASPPTIRLARDDEDEEAARTAAAFTALTALTALNSSDDDSPSRRTSSFDFGSPDTSSSFDGGDLGGGGGFSGGGSSDTI